MRYFATLGRVLLGLFFLLAAWDMFHADHGMMMQRMTEHNVPMMPTAFTIAMWLQAACGAAMLLGFATRYAALLLAVFVLAMNYYLHNFWGAGMPAADAADAMAAMSPDQMNEMVAFVRNLAIAGGLFGFAGFGAGPLSLDNRGGMRR